MCEHSKQALVAVLISLAPGTASAKCILKMPSADWGKPVSQIAVALKKQFGVSVLYECKSAKCGGPGNLVALNDKKIRTEIYGDGIKKLSSGPLELDGLRGKRESSGGGIGETYFGPGRILSFMAWGSAKSKNFAVLKASLRCS